MSAVRLRESFDPPILLNRDMLPECPATIGTRREARMVLEILPSCGIQWCGVVGCLERANISELRRALANALDRYGFLSVDDIDARRTALKEGSMVSRWLDLREMQARRAQAAEEKAMANREQKSNREKLKPKRDKSKEAPTQGSSYAAQYGKPAGKKK